MICLLVVTTNTFQCGKRVTLYLIALMEMMNWFVVPMKVTFHEVTRELTCYKLLK